jgi:hypothetical protein
MPRDYEVKINRNAMTVMISNGLSKQSSKISLVLSFSRFHPSYPSLGPNQSNAEKPQGLQFKPQNKFVVFVGYACSLHVHVVM